MLKTVGEMVLEQIGRSEVVRQTVAKERKGCDIVTISRELGSRGKEIAHAVADRLGWSMWDRRLVEAMADDADVQMRVVERFDEKEVTELEALAHALAGDYEVSGFLYRHHLAKALLAISRIGHAVILGRGANFLLPHSLRVRVYAGTAYRINTLVERGMTPEQAEAEIRESDREREGFIRRIFQGNINDPLGYDLIIKTDQFGIAGSAEVIAAAVEVHCH